MKSQLQGFFVGEKIRHLLDCDAAFVEHCERLNYKAEPSRNPELVSPTMGRALLEIALGYGELADSGHANMGLYEAASTITTLICDRDENATDPDETVGRSLTLKRLLGRRGGMAVAQTITRVLVKVDQLAPWDEDPTIEAWKSFLRHYCLVLWRESGIPADESQRDAVIDTLLEMLFGSSPPSHARAS